MATRLRSPSPTGTSPRAASCEGAEEGAQRPWWRRWFLGSSVNSPGQASSPAVTLRDQDRNEVEA
jgi:hypothetical protein